jgi:kynurenine formamidase
MLMSTDKHQIEDNPPRASDSGTPQSLWGANDQIGAANELFPNRVLEALSLAREGRVLDLSQPLCRESPRLPVVQSPYTLCLWSNPVTSKQWFVENDGARNGVAFAEERVELDLHTGTHIDALAHTWVNGRTYNRFTTTEVVGNWGLKRCGIEHLPPVVTRAILLDVAALRGRILEPGEVITVRDLELAEERQGVSLSPGDIAFVRTGWARYYRVANDIYVGAAPGLGLSAARWLTSQRVVAAGADTMCLEVYPSEQADSPFAIHQHLLARTGTYIIEQANLEELASLGVWEFLCLCLAPAFEGATGAPIRLTAVI